MGPFHSLDLKSQSASLNFCMSSRGYNGQNRAVTEWPVVLLIDRFPCL